MQLGDVIARFEDDAFVSETLFALDDLTLTARITAAAVEENVSAGEFAAQAVGQFVNGASDEEWLTLIGLMSRADNPGQASAACAIECFARRNAVADDRRRPSEGIVRWRYLWASVLAIVLMIAGSPSTISGS